jgi:hypothetical protein
MNMKTNLLPVKKCKPSVAFLLTTLLPLTAIAQTPAATTTTAVPPTLNKPVAKSAEEPLKFDLDFPGGTPQHLVKAIETSSGQPVNAIIPPECADVKLPALKMRQVMLEDLFQGLGLATQRTALVLTPQRQYSQARFATGFRRQGNVWYFYQEKPEFPEPAKICRFYQLAPYLKAYKIEDITTAIKTAWKMLGETKPPTLSFHEETKMLIAVGDPAQLQVIEAALEALRPVPERGEPVATEAKSDAPKKPSGTKP